MTSSFSFKIFFLFSLTLLVSLGTWQLYRLQWKNALNQERLEALKTRPVSLQSVIKHRQSLEDTNFYKSFLYHPITIKGYYLPEKTVTLLAKTYQGQAGRRVITAFVTEDGPIIWIDRGWVPEEMKNQATLIEDSLTLEGLIYEPLLARQSIFAPTNIPHHNEWYSMDLTQLDKAHSLESLPFYIVLVRDVQAPLSYPVAVTVNDLPLPNSHLAYALTWYALAIALGAIYRYGIST